MIFFSLVYFFVGFGRKRSAFNVWFIELDVLNVLMPWHKRRHCLENTILVSIVMSFSVTACKQYDEQHSCPPKNSLLFILATFICQLEKAFLILCDI